MFDDTRRRIIFWENEIERLEIELEEAKINNLSDDEIIDLQMDLYEAKGQLNFAWQDDELEEMGLR